LTPVRAGSAQLDQGVIGGLPSGVGFAPGLPWSVVANAGGVAVATEVCRIAVTAVSVCSQAEGRRR